MFGSGKTRLTPLKRGPGLTAIDRILSLDKDLRPGSRDIRRIVVHPNRDDFLRIERIHCDERTVFLRIWRHCPWAVDRLTNGELVATGAGIVASSVRRLKSFEIEPVIPGLAGFPLPRIQPTLIAVPSEHDVRRSRTHNHVPHFVDRSSHRECLWQ